MGSRETIKLSFKKARQTILHHKPFINQMLYDFKVFIIKVTDIIFYFHVVVTVPSEGKCKNKGNSCTF